MPAEATLGVCRARARQPCAAAHVFSRRMALSMLAEATPIARAAGRILQHGVRVTGRGLHAQTGRWSRSNAIS